MRCTPENDFFPDLSATRRTDVIFFCSARPTTPPGTRRRGRAAGAAGRVRRSILVYDSAYSAYVSDGSSPKSIYEIPASKEVAIEISSFSKFAGFTGVRLGWTVVPEELRFSDGSPVIKDFDRIVCTCFNGASSVAQAGGLACLSPHGLEALKGVIGVYKENAKILLVLDAFSEMGMETHGGANSPYVWVRFPGRKSSWDVFAEILEDAHVITIPGVGFGPGGEGFIRFSSFGRRADVEEACRRLKALLRRRKSPGGSSTTLVCI